MAVSPVNASRISFNSRASSMLQSVRTTTANLFVQQARLASGRAFATPSDDPVAAGRAMKFGQLLERQDQILANLQYADSFLISTDAAMAEVSDLLIEAESVASQNVGVTAGPEDRESAAEVIASIVGQMVSIGNRQFNGRYIFAGRDTASEPFVSALGGTAYVGDTGNLLTRIAELEHKPVNLPGDAAFSALSARVAGSVDLDPALSMTTRLEDLAGAQATGISRGVIVFDESSGAGRFQVDLAEADTIGDVVDLINDAAATAGSTITASLSSTGLTISSSSSALTITDQAGGSVADNLGILAEVATTGTIDGLDLNRRISAGTLIGELNGGAGLDLTAEFTITNGNTTATIDLSAAVTVQDMLNKINNAGVYVRAEINESGSGLDVLNQVSGMTMTIAESGGLTATTLGIRSFHADSVLSELNFGQGVEIVDGEDDFQVMAKDGSTFDVDLDGAVTVGDVLDAINAAATEAGVGVSASMASVGNGIRLVDQTGGSDALSVVALNGSFAADDLGLLKAADPAETELIGDDANPVRVDSVLSALMDLETALRNDNTSAITDAGDRIAGFLDHVAQVRGILGARAKEMLERSTHTATAVFATQKLLASVEDLDYTEAITQFQKAQTALQANLLTGARILNTSLMDFIG